MPRHLNHPLVLLVLAVAATTTPNAWAAGPGTPPPNPFGQLIVPPDPPASIFEDRMTAELLASYGTDFTDATVKSVRCPNGYESYDRYTGLTRVCPYEFGRQRVRWSGAITFYSDTSPATSYTYERPKATPYGLRQRYCRPNRSWTVRNNWRIAKLTASRRAGNVPGCEDAIDVVRHVTARGTTRRVPQNTRVANAYSPYGIGFGEDSNPWSCRTTGAKARPTVSCRGRFDRTFTARLRRPK